MQTRLLDLKTQQAKAVSDENHAQDCACAQARMLPIASSQKAAVRIRGQELKGRFPFASLTGAKMHLILAWLISGGISVATQQQAASHATAMRNSATTYLQYMQS